MLRNKHLGLVILMLCGFSGSPDSALADPINCAQFWADGWPSTGELDRPCYEHPTLSGDGRIRVFYPPDFPVDTRLAGVTRIFEAAERSMESFDELGRMGPVTLLIENEAAESSSDETTGPFMAVETQYVWPDVGEPCPLFVFPSGLADLNADEMKQAVAHEMFHCFQLQWLFGQLTEPEPGAMSWWAEGTATYFINGPYPHGDLEHLLQSNFDPAYSLFEHSYSNTGFFQSYSASLGRDAVLELLDAMPTSGGVDEQAAALSAIPDIDLHFHQFGERYLDQAIPDDGGGLIGLAPRESPVRVIGESGEVSFDFDPFLLSHHLLRFGAGANYHIDIRTTDGAGRESQRPADSPGSWSGVPVTIEAACGTDEDRLFLATSTDLPGQTRTVQLLVRREPRSDCCSTGDRLDPSLVGTWRANPDDLQAQVFPVPGGERRVSGGITVRIDENGQFTQRYDDLDVTVVRDWPNAPQLTFSDRTSGVVTGCLAAEGMGDRGALFIELQNRSTSIARTHPTADAKPLHSDEENVGLAFGVPAGGSAVGVVKPDGPGVFYNKKVRYERVGNRQPR